MRINNNLVEISTHLSSSIIQEIPQTHLYLVCCPHVLKTVGETLVSLDAILVLHCWGQGLGFLPLMVAMVISMGGFEGVKVGSRVKVRVRG